MVNPSLIVNALVEQIQKIPAVVTQLTGDVTRIYAYQDSPPQKSSLSRAIYEMTSPSVMVAWMGTSPTTGMTLWGHEVSIYVRGDDSTYGNNQPTFANLVTAIINGIPQGSEQSMLNLEVLDYVLPMDVPTIRRIHDDEGTIDLFEIVTRFEEKGDFQINSAADLD